MLENSSNADRSPIPPMLASPALGELRIDMLEPLKVHHESLELYARAAPGNHPCVHLGGFDSPEQMAMSGEMEPRLKGAVGWRSLEEMLRSEIDQARGHGISGLGMLEEIEDHVWRLSSTEPAAVAILGGHRLTREVDLSGPAIEAATPGSSQALIIEALRVHKWGYLAGVELPMPTATVELSNGTVLRHRERHVVVFPDRVRLEAEELGRFSDVMPVRSR